MCWEHKVEQDKVPASENLQMVAQRDKTLEAMLSVGRQGTEWCHKGEPVTRAALEGVIR